MSGPRFRAALAGRSGGSGPRRWLYLPYDQLTDAFGPLSRIPAAEVGIVLVESAEKARRRPYHKQKLALVLANQRQFALEQAARGVAVDYRASRRSIAAVLADVVQQRGPLLVARPAERELRQDLAPLFADGRLQEIPHEGWLTSPDDLAAAGGPPWRMDAFYRQVRRRTGILMSAGRPDGGRFSFDGENRRAWKGEPAAPSPPRFHPDPITLEVGEWVARAFGDHPGTLDLSSLPATLADAEHAWRWALAHCLPEFGPFEDAMSVRSRGLFHTRIAPLLHLHRLLPRRVVTDAARADLPLNSREGFVRQILGWREFVHQVHQATDGLRVVAGRPLPADVLGRDRPLPPAFWGTASGLACLDQAVADVWETGWTHHIPRLMVLSNLASLLDVDPQAVSDWFWVAFVDAFDWVVEPNVLGMGTFARGDLLTTKPYVAGSAYVHRMSDLCGGCAFDPGSTCPITSMYWAFLDRHYERLSAVDRMKLPLSGLARRSAAVRAADAAAAADVADRLARGERLTPSG